MRLGRRRLRIAFLLIVALGFLAAVRWAAPRTLAGPNCSGDASIDTGEAEFLGLINDYRQQNGLSPLTLSDTLNRAAAWKSSDMGANGYFDHDDTSIGRTWMQRLRDCGYTSNTWIGENIAAGNETAAATFDQWRNSPGHNASMLSSSYAAIGIGRAYSAGSLYGWYWTTAFGGVADGAPPTPQPTATPTPTARPSVTIPLPPSGPADPNGDVNCVGTTSAVDAALILQMNVALISSLPCLAAGDVDRNGALDAVDAALILQYAAGLIHSLPA